jgi:hypothetical protein
MYIDCVQKTVPSFFISPGQVQLFDETFTCPCPMSGSVDAQILEYHNQGATRDMICSLLHVRPNRVSRILNFFRDHHQLSPRVGKGPKKVTRNILDLITIRTIQSPQQSLKALSDEIHLERKLNEKEDNRSKSYQRCERSEKLNIKVFFIKKQTPVNQAKITINHSISRV